MRALLLAVAVVLVGAGPARAARTYYAAVGGIGTDCTSVLPCSAETALNAAGPTDTVHLASGTYPDGETNEVAFVSALVVEGATPRPVLLWESAGGISDATPGAQI